MTAADLTASAPSRRRWDRALVIAFLAALVFPALDLALRLDGNPSPLREVVPFPALHLDRSLVKFPGKLMWYVKSSMGFRGALVRARGLFAWNVLGVSPAPESAGRGDPWLFLRAERVDDDFRHVDPLSPAEVERWRAVLEARRDWLARRGIRYLVVVAPNKETIYSQAVPRWFTRAPGPSRLSQLGDSLRRAGSVDFLDLSGALDAQKGRERVYHFTDTHWNDLGAFAGYRAISVRMKAWFPDLRPLGPDDVSRESVFTPGGDLARVCGLQLDRLEPQVQLHVRPALATATFADGSPVTFERTDVHGQPDFETRSRDGEIGSAIILRDSFGEALVPYLSRHFQKARWIWTYEFPARLIDEQHPSLVIEQMVERKLMVLLPANPPEVEAAVSRGR